MEDYYYRQSARELTAAMRFLGDISGKTGLDLGGSAGWAAYRFASQGARMVLADYNDSDTSGMGLARVYIRRTGWFPRVRVDAEALPFDDAQFDFIYSNSFLHHLTCVPAGVAEIARVLKPDGIYIAAYESFHPLFARRESVIGRCWQARVFIDHGVHEQVLRQGEYLRAFRRAGLQVIVANPRWDRISPRRVRFGAKVRARGYVPEILHNRVRTGGGATSLLCRMLIGTGAWRLLSPMTQHRAARNLFLQFTQKHRLLIGIK